MSKKHKERLQKIKNAYKQAEDNFESQKDKPKLVFGVGAEYRDMWFNVISQDETDDKYNENYKRIKDAEKIAEEKDIKKRPIYAVGVSCSGSSNNGMSCSHTPSKSKHALEQVLDNLKSQGAETKMMDLWDYIVTPCNGCYSAHSRWCHFPCSCFPFDNGQNFYEEFTKADIIVISTPTNEAGAATRFYEMWHRMISMDGGMDFKPHKGWKKTKEEMERMKKETIEKGLLYKPRFSNKVFGVVVLGHEEGASLAAAQIKESIGYRGGFVPPDASIAKNLVGKGDPLLDWPVYAGHRELENDLHNASLSLYRYAVKARETDIDTGAKDQMRT